MPPRAPRDDPGFETEALEDIGPLQVSVSATQSNATVLSQVAIVAVTHVPTSGHNELIFNSRREAMWYRNRTCDAWAASRDECQNGVLLFMALAQREVGAPA